MSEQNINAGDDIPTCASSDIPEDENIVQESSVVSDIPGHKVCVFLILHAFNLHVYFQTLMCQAGASVRTSLKVLETLMYSCTNPTDLWELHSKVEEQIAIIISI